MYIHRIKNILVAIAVITTIAGADSRLLEQFEGAFPPAGWSVVDNAGSGNIWMRNDAAGEPNQAAYGSGYSAAADASNSNSAWDSELRSPSVSLINFQNPVLTYASNFQDYAGNGDIWLDISTDGGTTWTTLRYSTADDPSGGTMENEDLSAYAGNIVVFRWRYVATSSSAWFWHIDDVNVTGISTGVPYPPTTVPLSTTAKWLLMLLFAATASLFLMRRQQTTL